MGFFAKDGEVGTYEGDVPDGAVDIPESQYVSIINDVCNGLAVRITEYGVAETFTPVEPTFDPPPESEPTPEEAWAALRAERDARLAATDWRVLRTIETGEPLTTEWQEYRQALREITSTVSDPTSPNWPQEPT